MNGMNLSLTERKNITIILYLWSFNITTFAWITGPYITMDGEVNEKANDVTIVVVGTTTNKGKNIL